MTDDMIERMVDAFLKELREGVSEVGMVMIPSMSATDRAMRAAWAMAHEPTEAAVKKVEECLEGHHSQPRPFDLARAMENGGRCLAGDRPARIVCTDAVGLDTPVLVLVTVGVCEVAWFYDKEGHCGHSVLGPGEGDLRNLPESVTVEVTLWEHPGPRGDFNVSMNAAPNMGDAKPYGPPVPVKFPKGEV